MPIRILIAAFALALSSVASRAAAADDAPVVASREDAFIAHDASADVWTIGSRELTMAVGFDGQRRLGIQRLLNPVTGRTWDITPGADGGVTINGEHVSLGSGSTLTFLGADAQADDDGVRLVFNFEHRVLHVRIARAYACYPGSPTIETWTRLDAANSTGAVTLADLVGWRITMPAATVRWLGGLRGDTADVEQAGAFELAYRDLDEGDRLEIGGSGRSSERDVPFVMVDAGADEFYGGVMWSGAWQIAVDGVSDDRLTVAAHFPGVVTTLSRGRPFEVPHTFFGVTSHSATDESGALRQFIMRGIRHGRPFQPLVTYNTWFAYGSTIDQNALTGEIELAASMGIELFVVDAGWYAGAGTRGQYDFATGLGTWTVDPERFPDGLAALADQAHEAGMKFGLWVEPERVALDAVGRGSLARETWLATRGGNYGGSETAQICLSHPDAHRWVLDRLVELIESAHPDYLKWDNNSWINCDRTGHGHDRADGNFAHVRALYDLLGELRARYPDLLIENVSGGGNRLDFGMLAYTDVAWMDDRSVPSTHVRHNLEGLTFVFPPAYLLSLVIDSEAEPISGGEDLPLVVRSRMPGVLGVTYRTSDMDDALNEGLSAEIRNYKVYRDIVAFSNATLLSDQAPVDGQSWDVLQELADDRRSAVVFAFKSDPSEGRLVVRPRGLAADVVYEVVSLDAGRLGTARGDTLMRDGVELDHRGGSAAHIVVLRAQ